MILKASLFRLSNLAYKTATKKKLNLFINIIIFISFFAISAATLSLYFENKIDELDRKIILTEVQKIILENQISAVPNSLNSISLIKDSQLSEQSNLDILGDINPGGVMYDSIITSRDKSFKDYYDIITLVDISVLENQYYIDLTKSIFEDNPKILKEISKYEITNDKNKEEINKIYLKASTTENNWKKYDAENRISKYGYFGFYVDVHSEGILVEEITEDTPISRSKLKEGDIILSINEKTYKNLDNRSEIKIRVKPNIPAKFVVKSNNEISELTIIPIEQFNNELYDLKDKNYYLKFNEYFKRAKKILNDQESIFLRFGLNFAIKNLEKLNDKINILNKELEKISKKESRTIFFAFIIQLIIFFSSQYFEFSIGQQNEKKKRTTKWEEKY